MIQTVGPTEHLSFYKIVVIGDSNVGKNALLARFVDEEYDYRQFQVTIGIELKWAVVDHGGEKIKLEFWGPAGTHRDPNTVAQCCPGADGVVLVYDITDRQSFENIGVWLKDIQKDLPENAERMLVTMLLGNKCDMEEKRIISQKDGEGRARQLGCRFKEVSAKHHINVKAALDELVAAILERRKGRTGSSTCQRCSVS
ncbi:ras-related protein Rab-10-like [Paramacrobiotus metropolitanus]|uniref:ras-related protein Rab-10-like n=1 Tax=Paramacrobiotus metropolitanus TaxID=2943436 RepID=UPI002445D25A|nr:ras-related protein Rab-10-like [Paramacrobiotus metropolitanus]